MISIILLIFFVLLYHISEGATEGYIWADEIQRQVNCIIKGSASGNGIFDYHGWRFFETVGIIGTVLTYYRVWYHNFGIWMFWMFIGSWLSGYFFYERILNLVVNGSIFKPEGWIFGIFGFEIPRYFWQDILLLIIGVSLIIYGINKRKKGT